MHDPTLELLVLDDDDELIVEREKPCCPSPDTYELRLPEGDKKYEWNCPSCGSKLDVEDRGLWD